MPLRIVFTEDKALYFDALEKARKEEDLSFFRDFMFGQYAKHLRIEMDKYKNMDQDLPGKNRFSFIF